MRKFIYIALLTIITSYSFFQLGTMINYVSDIKEYTELFCENKETPDLHCNGKCHLTKELAQNEEQKQNDNLRILPEINLIVNQTEIVVINNFIPVKDDVFYYQENTSQEELTPPFQPPRTLI